MGKPVASEQFKCGSVAETVMWMAAGKLSWWKASWICTRSEEMSQHWLFKPISAGLPGLSCLLIPLSVHNKMLHKYLRSTDIFCQWTDLDSSAIVRLCKKRWAMPELHNTHGWPFKKNTTYCAVIISVQLKEEINDIAVFVVSVVQILFH